MKNIIDIELAKVIKRLKEKNLTLVNFQGKDTITVRVQEVDGEKKLLFDATSGSPAGELVGAGNESKT